MLSTNVPFHFRAVSLQLAGLDFYRSAVGFAKKYNTKKIPVHFALQTNGLAIDKSWAEFLSENHFLVGLSLDGYKDTNDAMRVDPQGNGSYNRIMDTARLFNEYNVEYNILCVVNSYIARHISKVYNFFRKNGFKYLQFIPCLDPLGEAPGMHEFSLTPERYTQFLKNLFDEWYRDIIDGRSISIRYFDNLIGLMLGYPPEACDMVGVCSTNFVIEANGGVYPCDFYVTDEWYLGNIMDIGFAKLAEGLKAREFVEASMYTDPACSNCSYRFLCRGGCRRLREPFADGRPGLNIYCSSYKAFFDYAGKRLQEIARRFSMT